jgi:(S)-ureidoglycine aminohydrolase
MKQDKMLIVDDADITSRCRAINKPGIYSILPASNRVFSYLPGFKDVAAQVLATPQLGARFVQYELVVQPNGGTSAPYDEALEQFMFVLDGEISFELDGKKSTMEKGGFCWLPPSRPFQFTNRMGNEARIVWIRRRYVEAKGIAIPEPIISHESKVVAEPVDTYMEQHLTPYENLAFDMGINLQVFDPGVYFSDVESHIMEHGLYMVAGRGIYWLNGDYLETRKDDFIYMAPFCPQFFYATGWDKSAYLLYKDVNRDYVDMSRM